MSLTPRDWWQIIHVPDSTPIAVIPVCGVLLSGSQFNTSKLFLIFAVGLFLSISGHLINDLADYELDKSVPSRAVTPLVSGRTSRRAVSILAITFLVFAAIAMFVMGVNWFMLCIFLVGESVITLYSVYGKRHFHAFVNDLMQGGAFGLLVLFGVYSVGHVLTEQALLAALFVLFSVVLANVRNSLRDLKTDLAAGIVTTAAILGCYTSDDGSVRVSSTLKTYAITLHAILVVLASLLIRSVWRAGEGWSIMLSTLFYSLLVTLGSTLLWRSLSPEHVAHSAKETIIYLTNANVFLLSISSPSFLVFVVLLGVVLIPILIELVERSKISREFSPVRSEKA